MALKYKIASTKKPGQGKEGEQIWFPKLTGTSQADLNQIAQILAQRSSASQADVYLIVMGLVDLIPELLSEGKTVKLDNLGTFRLHARVETASSPNEVTVHKIKELRMSFLPDKRIKQALKVIKVKKE